MPGGYGQTDIWMCNWENNKWGKPENLGVLEKLGLANNSELTVYAIRNGLVGE